MNGPNGDSLAIGHPHCPFPGRSSLAPAGPGLFVPPADVHCVPLCWTLSTLTLGRGVMFPATAELGSHQAAAGN